MKQWLAMAFLGLAGAADAAEVKFDWFEYTGRDEFRTAPPVGHYRNPVLPGYYPDPSVTRVGDKFYLVNSTFAHWPGIPIHESTDLVHWKLIGHALNDPSKVKFDGLDISRGVFAPAIEYHDGTFYVINTLVDAGGNFFVTSKHPGGPYSDPVWLPEIDGIDPSFYFDDDGKAYVLNNGPPDRAPLYDGHRAIWMQEFDVAKQKLVGPRKVIVDGGVDISKKPIWIEGPHIYKVDGTYYLLCAEGGTGEMHSAVVFRSKSPWGPWVPYQGNPILTQRDLDKDRANPVTSTGHADLVQKTDGSWWALFLGTRPYKGDSYNTGRETFLLPITWKDGWPVILPPGVAVPSYSPLSQARKRPRDAKPPPLSGEMRSPTVRDDFAAKSPGPEWLQIYVPRRPWFATAEGALAITPQKANLDAKVNTSFLARRQQDQKFDASTQISAGLEPGVAAGLAAYQNHNHWYFLAARRTTDGLDVFLERRFGQALRIVALERMAMPATLKLRIRADGPNYSFDYDAGAGWRTLNDNDDGSILSTNTAGGFVGTVLGPFARQE
ncbi:MAG: glycoside hydrolase family 43 protein [Steroidobacteraceae bacterium]|nr:glycoside hydrolase family 43 protein [Steroidobacteraceae bacterium]